MKIYDDKKFIGNVIKKARKNAKLSQAMLSEKLGMSEKNLGNIENGKQYPQVNNLFRIMEELNLSLEDFCVQLPNQKQRNLKSELLYEISTACENETDVYLEILKSLKKLKK